MSEQTTRIIKKYPNRRIYDTETSAYITLNDVRCLIVEGIEFKVVDTQTKKDITRNILLQIIVEQESETDPLFSTENLQRFIRYYSENQQHGFSDFINQSIGFFQQQQEQFQSSMNDLFKKDPIQAWSDVSKKNLEMWQEMQGNWFGNTGKDKSE